MRGEKITLREILWEIYTQNRVFFYLYFGLIAVILVGTLPAELSKRRDYASGVQAMENEIVTEEQGTAVGGSVYTGIVAVANATGSSIEPISVLFVESVVSLSGKFMDGKLSSIVENVGLLQNDVVCYIIILLFVVLKVLRGNTFTKITGMVAEDIENKIGMFISAAGPFLIYFAEHNDLAYAAGYHENNLGQALQGGVSILGIVMLSMVLLAAYYVVRTIVYALEIVMTPFYAIPLVSGITEVVKTVSTILMVVFVAVAPVIAILVYGLLFIGCLFLFKKAYVTVRYFKSIYIMPIFRKKNKEFVDRKKATKFLGADENVKLFFPVFAHGRINDKIGKYDKCWLYLREDEIMVCKSRFMKRELLRYSLCQVAEENCFIDKNFWYIEIFALNDADASSIHYNPFKLKKINHFIISKEYAQGFEALCQVLKFKNYKEYQQELKRRKKEEQYEQKMRRKQESIFLRKRKTK